MIEAENMMPVIANTMGEQIHAENARKRKPVLLIVGPLPPPFIGPAVATDRLLKSSLLHRIFMIQFLNTSDPSGFEDMGRLSWRNISLAFRHISKCWLMLIASRPDVMYVPIDRAFWGFLRDAMLLLPARMLGVKTFLHLRAGRFDLRHDFGIRGRVLARLGLLGTTRGIVLGETVRDVFGKYISPKNIRIVPNGIDLQNWTESKYDAGASKNTIDLLYLANLYRGKGAHILLRALPQIIEAVPNVKATFAGKWLNEDFREECCKLVRSCNLDAHVEFVGQVDEGEKRRLLASTDILIFVPIESEGLPWVVLEAMASGIPVVGTPQGTMKEVILDEETGYIVPPFNEDELADRVIQLASNSHLRKILGANGRKRVAELYSEDAAHQRLIEVMMEALKEKIVDGQQNNARVEMPTTSNNGKLRADKAGGVDDVRSFWDTEACGSQFVHLERGTREFYEQYRRVRYSHEWHIPLVVPFADANGKNVLEIGCGNGADGVMFAQNGASYTGVDLTPEAVAATKSHFEALGLIGRFQTENAEHLSFDNDSFQMVYSHGVLHHTPRPQEAINEVYRVLKPGGKAVIMLYHKRSFNYYFRIMLYMRMRLLVAILLRLGRWRNDRKMFVNDLLSGTRGNQNKKIWWLHYRNFLREGWKYLKAANFVHHATDGPECPYAFAYSKKEALGLFSKFVNVRMQAAHFPLRKYLSWIPLSVEAAIAPKIGWYLFIFAEKP